MKTFSDIPNLTDRVTRKAVEGKSFNICRNLYLNGGNTSTYVSADKTKVRLITRIACWTQAGIETSPSGTTSSATNTIMYLKDSTGTTRETLPLHAPSQWGGTSMTAGLATQANNDRTLIWEPLHPLVIPEGWSLAIGMDTTAAASQSVSLWMQAFEMDVHEARALGYPCSPDDGASSTTTARRWIQTGTQVPAASNTVVTGHGNASTGDYIRIDDIVVRMNPSTVGTGGEWIELRESDDSVIFRWTKSAKTGEPLEKIIRGPIYTKTRGNGLKVVASSTNVYNQKTTSIIIVGEFVSSKPENSWYAYKNPTISSPAYQTNGTVNVVATVLKSAPGLGLRHVVEGVDFSGGAADVMNAVSGVVATISSGTSADTSILAPSANNIVILPTWAMASKLQQTNFTIDRSNMPTKENANIYFENQVPAVTPTVNSVVDWGVTIWGYTEPTSPNASTVTTKYKG